MSKSARVLASSLLAVTMASSSAVVVQAAPADGVRLSGTWFETAFASWTGAPDDGYRAYVRALDAYDWRDDTAIEGWLTDWEEVDAPLLREVDPHRDTWRVDVPGLPRGEYEIQVRAADGTTVVDTFEDLQTRSFPRHGAAFVPSDENDFEGSHDFALDGAVGGYLPDGRVDPSAEVVYVTHETMDEALPADLFADRTGSANERTPLVVRLLGTVGSFDEVTASPEEAGAEVPPGAFNGNRKWGIGAGNGNVTVEGVGHDAVLYGWGLSTGGAHNVVFRNLTFDQFFDDALEVHGGGTGVRASNVWVHHNTFSYGQNKFLNIPDTDPDQAKGDGATDVVNHARNYTIAYNHYAGSSKSMLIGGGTGSISAHYGTIHHNWFEDGEERTPRVRNGRVHVFNNIYQDIQGHPFHDVLLERNTGYGIGAGHNATVWAEGNIFEDVNFPFLRSRQGHARGHQAIDYQPGPDESASANAGFNHFFGDAPGFIVTAEVVNDGDFPDSVEGFRNDSDYLPGLTQDGLDSLRQAALDLQPNVLDAASRENFDPTLDIGVRVADGSTTTNPDMSTTPPAQLDWSFRPSGEGVWPTGTTEDVAELRTEIESGAGTMTAPPATVEPQAPTVTGVVVNDEVRSVGGTFLPEPRVVVYADTFTIDWVSDDVLAESYEIQWDQGTGEWETIGAVPATARPTTYVTQELNQFANVGRPLAQATDDAVYAFRVNAVSSAGASPWSQVVCVDGSGEAPEQCPGVIEEPGEPGPDRRTAEFHLSNTWRGSTDVHFMYGRWADAVLIGDWDGDGVDTIAVRRDNVFHVSNAQTGGDADVVLTYGRPGDVILVGDWNGDGTDTFAVRRGNEYHVKNSLRGGDADSVFRYGRDDDEVLVGDWDGDGTDTFAVRRGAVYHVKNSLRGGPADVAFSYGREADVTFAGDWDGNGTDTLAIQRGRTYHVNNSLRGGDADTVVTFGRLGDEVHVGDWDGNGTDTLGIRRPVGAAG